MLKPWHRSDIFAALARRGWSDPERVASDSYEIGEQYQLRREDDLLALSFIADPGTGYSDEKSIEEVVASRSSGEQRHRLWLHPRQDAKWKRSLLEWCAAAA